MLHLSLIFCFAQIVLSSVVIINSLFYIQDSENHATKIESFPVKAKVKLESQTHEIVRDLVQSSSQQESPLPMSDKWPPSLCLKISNLGKHLSLSDCLASTLYVLYVPRDLHVASHWNINSLETKTCFCLSIPSRYSKQLIRPINWQIASGGSLFHFGTTDFAGQFS